MVDRDPRDLMPERLRRIVSVRDIGAVPMRNSSDATHALASDGTRWVKKSVSANDLLAEALGTLLASDLEVPTAEGAYWIDEHGERW